MEHAVPALKSCKKQEFFDILATWIDNTRPTTIMGDINMNFFTNCKLNQFLEKLGFQQMIRQATHESGSLIDQVYVNQPLRALNIFTEQCAVYYSDHDMVTIYIPK